MYEEKRNTYRVLVKKQEILETAWMKSYQTRPEINVMEGRGLD
jgi:hypothetical protein